MRRGRAPHSTTRARSAAPARRPSAPRDGGSPPSDAARPHRALPHEPRRLRVLRMDQPTSKPREGRDRAERRRDAQAHAQRLAPRGGVSRTQGRPRTRHADVLPHLERFPGSRGRASRLGSARRHRVPPRPSAKHHPPRPVGVVGPPGNGSMGYRHRSRLARARAQILRVVLRQARRTPTPRHHHRDRDRANRANRVGAREGRRRSVRRRRREDVTKPRRRRRDLRRGTTRGPRERTTDRPRDTRGARRVRPGGYRAERLR